MVCLTSEYTSMSHEDSLQHFPVMQDDAAEICSSTTSGCLASSTTTGTTTVPSTSLSVRGYSRLNDSNRTSSSSVVAKQHDSNDSFSSLLPSEGSVSKFGGGTGTVSNSVFGGGFSRPTMPPKRASATVTSSSNIPPTNSKRMEEADNRTGDHVTTQVASPENAKHKLKSKLKSKLGNIDPAVLFAEKPRTPEEPSESDEERKSRRRHQNKMAARNSRQRRRELAEGATKEVQQLECVNTSLKYEIKQLEKERKRLAALLTDHEGKCKMKGPT